jgi:hypothetical protein
MRDRVIVCCTPFGEDWSWFVQDLTASDVRWRFYSDRARYFWQHLLQRPNFNTPVAGLLAALSAKFNGASLLISVDPRLSFWCSLFCRIFRVHTEHLVFSFNFPELPRGWKQRLFAFAFKRIHKLRVHSQMEVELYSEHFRIPQDRIQVGLWCMNAPEVDPVKPLHSLPYACAIGGNARDYQTLLLAAQLTPEIPMVWVVRPENVAGMDVPSHVKVVCNIPYGEAMNYLQHSQYMVLPLKGAEVPCGHVTIVSAMLLHKAIIATNSAGISDYVQEEVNGLLCRPSDPDHLADAMRTLWKDKVWSERLGEEGFAFAERNCSESKVREEMTVFFRERSLLRTNAVDETENTSLFASSTAQ